MQNKEEEGGKKRSKRKSITGFAKSSLEQLKTFLQDFTYLSNSLA